MFLPVRETGSSIWPEVLNTVNKKNKVEELTKKLEAATEEEEKESLKK